MCGSLAYVSVTHNLSLFLTMDIPHAKFLAGVYFCSCPVCGVLCMVLKKGDITLNVNTRHNVSMNES